MLCNPLLATLIFESILVLFLGINNSMSAKRTVVLILIITIINCLRCIFDHLIFDWLSTPLPPFQRLLLLAVPHANCSSSTTAYHLFWSKWWSLCPQVGSWIEVSKTKRHATFKIKINIAIGRNIWLRSRIWRTEMFPLSWCCDQLWKNICPPMFQVSVVQVSNWHLGQRM